MQSDNSGLNCTFSSFLMAALIGALGVVVLRFFAEYSWEGSIFLGVLIAGFLGLVFNFIFCRELPALGDIQAPGSDASNKPAEKPKAAQPAPATAPPVEKSQAAAPKAAPKPAPSAAPAAAPAAAASADEGTASSSDAEGKRPEALSQARDGGADNLKEIKGIGPKLEKLCNSLGFFHFDQIANWTPEEVAWVDANLEGFKGRVTRDEWVKQATILAAGGETEFSQRVDDGKVY